MSDNQAKQAITELQDLVECRCYDRGVYDLTCNCDTADAVKIVADRIEELEAKLAKAVEDCAGVADRMAEEAATATASEHAWQIAEAIRAELKGEPSDE